jgi:hypothetical protein
MSGPIEGRIVPDNREQRFTEITRGMVELTTEFRWEEVPPDLQWALRMWVREFFTWAVLKPK